MTFNNICIFGDVTLVKRKDEAFIVGLTSYNAHILNQGRLSYWHKQKHDFRLLHPEGPLLPDSTQL